MVENQTVTTGFPTEFDKEKQVKSAAEWLSLHLDDCPRPIIPYIKQAYGLCNLEACEAIRLAREKRR